MQSSQEKNYRTLVQLTDSHLFAQRDGALMGVKTQESLADVLKLVGAEQTLIDLLLCTGDISQDGTLSSYQRFAAMTRTLGVPMRWLAGNHDEAAALEHVCGRTDWLAPVTDVGQWRVVMLDSSVAGQVYGLLAEDQLILLEEALRSAGERHVLLAVHHHPLPINSHWMDQIGLHNADQLLSIIKRYSNVRAVLCGHVHQAFDQQWHGVRWLATPSTCIQFTPHSAEFAVDDSAPGYRWLRLYDDGQLETGVSRVEQIKFVIDRSASGY